MQGEQIRKIQKVVGVTPDGIYGPKTEKAVRSFQQKNGVTTDGIVGPKTWAILF
ncbi:peptidoglycan-binding protein [Metabacillus herbersteinensis]|uniref:Peptidoglycan-binding protein n=1 Tax=Metabacillus herbersteinensis TaxID=283816 RepID=A0ABV6GF52_9BACI